MPYIATEEVESSNIERIGYHRRQQILRVIFKGGRAYDYPMVTERDHRDLMAADSKGSFFNRRIKALFAHRTPRENELVEPCCEHSGSDAPCTEECFPCHDWCCSGSVAASPEQIREAIADGLAFGAAPHTVRKTDEAEPRTDGEKAAEFAEAYGASPETVTRIAAGNSGEGVEIGGDVEVPPAVPRTADGEIDMEAIPDATHLFDDDGDTSVERHANCGCTEESRCPELVAADEAAKACLHPEKETALDGSSVVCSACGVDLSESGDCPHGADGRVCEEGCSCIPCHANVPESPEVEAHSKALNEAQEVIENEEEETNGSSD